MNTRIRSSLMAVLILVSPAAFAAEIVTFNEFSANFQGSAPFSSGSLTFVGTTNSHGVWLNAPDVGEFNGTPYLLDGFGSQLTVQRTDLAPFRLDAFEMALGWYQSVSSADVSVTFDLAAGGTSSLTLPLTLSYQTFSPGLDITKATFDLGGASGGYISMDNIAIDTGAAPEPGTLALLGLGLAGLAATRRRKQ